MKKITKVMDCHIGFTYTTSRGRHTFGWGVCSMYVDGKKFGRHVGGNYDMKGGILGDWILINCHDALKELTANYGSGDAVPGCYGLSFWDGSKRVNKYSDGCKITVDGACGFRSMEKILNAIGLELDWVSENNYFLRGCLPKVQRENFNRDTAIMEKSHCRRCDTHG